MSTSNELTYILKYESPHTRTTIARIDRAGDSGLNTPHDVHLTADEDRSIEIKAKCWREKSEDGGDWLFVEAEAGNPDSRFYLPFIDAVHFSNEAQKKISGR